MVVQRVNTPFMVNCMLKMKALKKTMKKWCRPEIKKLVLSRRQKALDALSGMITCKSCRLKGGWQYWSYYNWGWRCRECAFQQLYTSGRDQWIVKEALASWANTRHGRWHLWNCLWEQLPNSELMSWALKQFETAEQKRFQKKQDEELRELAEANPDMHYLLFGSKRRKLTFSGCAQMDV